jgi:hypothetical protein
MWLQIKESVENVVDLNLTTNEADLVDGSVVGVNITRTNRLVQFSPLALGMRQRRKRSSGMLLIPITCPAVRDSNEEDSHFQTLDVAYEAIKQ